MDYYHTAQICLNGHVISSLAEKSTVTRKKFCDDCGESTIMNCPSCNSAIKGDFHMDDVFDFSEYKKPSFCDNCGKPYPWITRSIEAANSLIEISDSLNIEEKVDFKKCVESLMKDSPDAIVAQVKYKRYIGKIGKEIEKGMRDVLIEILSENSRKAIWNV